MAKYILKTKDSKEREFWCDDNGGYVWEIPYEGKIRQVSDHLGYSGTMLYADAKTLANRVRAARKRELKRQKQYEDWA